MALNKKTPFRTRSDFWYLLPIFGGFLGGLISWFAIKYDDPRKAKNCLILGAILTTIPIILMTIPFLIFSTSDFSMEMGDPYQPPIKFLDDFYI